MGQRFLGQPNTFLAPRPARLGFLRWDCAAAASTARLSKAVDALLAEGTLTGLAHALANCGPLIGISGQTVGPTL